MQAGHRGLDVSRIGPCQPRWGDPLSKFELGGLVFRREHQERCQHCSGADMAPQIDETQAWRKIGSQSRCRLRRCQPWLREPLLELIDPARGSPSWQPFVVDQSRTIGLVPKGQGHFARLSIQSSWGVVKKALRPLNGAPN